MSTTCPCGSDHYDVVPRSSKEVVTDSTSTNRESSVMLICQKCNSEIKVRYVHPYNYQVVSTKSE